MTDILVVIVLNLALAMAFFAGVIFGKGHKTADVPKATTSTEPEDPVSPKDQRLIASLERNVYEEDEE